MTVHRATYNDWYADVKYENIKRKKYTRTSTRRGRAIIRMLSTPLLMPLVLLCYYAYRTKVHLELGLLSLQLPLYFNNVTLSLQLLRTLRRRHSNSLVEQQDIFAVLHTQSPVESKHKCQIVLLVGSEANAIQCNLLYSVLIFVHR